MAMDEFEVHNAVRTLIDAEKIRADPKLMKKVQPALKKKLEETQAAALETTVATKQAQMRTPRRKN